MTYCHFVIGVFVSAQLQQLDCVMPPVGALRV